MPRIYLTASEAQEMPVGIALSAQIAQLPSGVLDKLLARVSQRADNYVHKRLGAPGSTTLSGSVSAGATSITVSSTLSLDNLAEQAVILDMGLGTQETALIQPGGVTVNSPWASPYPGTLALATPLQFGHSNGASVTYVYQEVDETGRASMSDPYSEALQSQAAQLALAHLPPVHVGLNRIQFLKNYPIITVYTVFHSYSFDTTYNLIYNSSDPTYNGQIIIEPTAGFYRYRVGTVVLPEGFTQTTYSAGLLNISDDIKLACANYLAEELTVFTNPYGASTLRQEAVEVAFARYGGGKNKAPVSLFVAQAEELLKPYRKIV